MKNSRVIRCVLFLLIFVFLFSMASALLRDKTGAVNMINLYQEPKDSLDVVFLGTSHMLCGVYPMELWNDYGIASNNFSQNSQMWSITYYALKETIERHHPALAVVDIYDAYVNSKGGTESYMHQTLDNFRPSFNKAQAILDVIPFEKRLEFFLPFTLYHGRWKNLTQADFSLPSLALKGANFIKAGAKEPFAPFTPVDHGETLEPHPVVLEYLDKMIKLSQQTGTQLLFIVLPFYAQGEQSGRDVRDDQRRFNWIENYVNERGFGYINYLYLLNEIGFDYDKDMLEWSHLNYYGSVKVGRHLGAYILEHYNVPDRRGDPAYAYWQDDLAEYAEFLHGYGIDIM